MTTKMKRLNLALSLLLGFNSTVALASSNDSSRIPDVYVPLQVDDVPARPEGFIEIGDKFLGNNAPPAGFTLPTGAVWQPSLFVFGNYRTALQTFQKDQKTTTEWANRLDLFANLRLTGTERLLVGFRPFDKDGKFAGYDFEANNDNDWREEGLNMDIQTLFFEGELGEIFPFLDPDDNGYADIGFSVGRQPFNIQDGFMINDVFDGAGLVFNGFEFPGAAYWKITALYGWNELHRRNNKEDRSSQLFGLFNEVEFLKATVNFDVAYVTSDNNDEGLFLGLSSVQRLGMFNTTFRANTSIAVQEESAQMRDGTLLFAELSFTPQSTQDLAYANVFWGIDEYSSAGRGPSNGGPLGRTGILFAAVGLGGYKPALSNSADKAFGGSLGYQMLFNGGWQQVIVEVGGRQDTSSAVSTTAIAAAVSYKQRLGNHSIVRFDAFAGDYENDDNLGYGFRTEFQFKF
ncbi:MAG: hypothetical protein GQ569_05585 [Methylococcaceae bacterium]|nr:hypothetical protein [Methylococcaceae bacterium]